MKQAVTISYEINRETLRCAIASILRFGGLRITKSNISDVIRNEVKEHGNSVIQHPELWGGNITDFVLSNPNEVEYWCNKVGKYFKL